MLPFWLFMDSAERVRQIINLGLPVYCGSFNEANLSVNARARSQVVGLWPDGSEEIIYRRLECGRIDIKRLYKAELREVLRKEGIDPTQIVDRLPIMDLHVLKTAGNQVYEFFLPSIVYLEGWHVRKKN